MRTIKPTDFAAIYEEFRSPLSRFDCGRKCAPLNDGVPVCCDSDSAVPVADVAEWRLLKDRTKLWHLYQPDDAVGRKIKDELPTTCRAIECKGARFCERDNRTLACRAFPFFPYVTRQKQFIGLAHYWDFEDRCWVASNMQIVERKFIDEFVAAFTAVFAKDSEEWDTYIQHSAIMRRVFSRWKRKIPLLHRDGGAFLIAPSSGEMTACDPAEFPKLGPYKSEAAYARAVQEAGGTVPEEGLAPALPGRRPSKMAAE